MIISLYNTLSRRIEEFKPLQKGKISFYACGPTVYDHPQIGNLRTYVNNDLLRRMFEYNGYHVKHVMNITDVGHLRGDRDMGEDKLELASKRESLSAWEIAQKYEEEFFQMMKKLNVLKPTTVCRATEHIPLMIEFIQKIEKAGYTYLTDDGLYFDTSKLPNYNELSKMPLEKLKEGARVEPNPQKRNPTDFALWKFSPAGQQRQMEWDAPWRPPKAKKPVKGFPGWHIECSAMSIHYLGEKFDLHVGGVDHINVHHTNEIAQNQAVVGKQVVNYWFHNEFLLVEGKKMSKSLGNFYTLFDLDQRELEPLSLRYLFLNTHYRKKLNFTWPSLESAQQSLERIREIVKNLKREKSEIIIDSVKPEKTPQDFKDDFFKFINADLDIPQALAVFWEVLRSDLSANEKIDLVFDFDRIFGLDLRSDFVKETIPLVVHELAEKRWQLKSQKKWAEADRIRKEIEKKGFAIRDLANSFVIERKKE